MLSEASSSQTAADIWPNRTLTENISSSLVVKAGTFKANHNYVFKLSVTNADGKYAINNYYVLKHL